MKLYNYTRTTLAIPPKPSLTFRRSSKWKNLRDEFIKENGSKCAICGFKTNLEVHHIIPLWKDRSRELDKTNLIVLCENKSLYCHFVFGHLFSWMAYNPNVIDDAVLMRQRIKNRSR